MKTNQLKQTEHSKWLSLNHSESEITRNFFIILTIWQFVFIERTQFFQLFNLKFSLALSSLYPFFNIFKELNKLYLILPIIVCQKQII